MTRFTSQTKTFFLVHQSFPIKARRCIVKFFFQLLHALCFVYAATKYAFAISLAPSLSLVLIVSGGLPLSSHLLPQSYRESARRSVKAELVDRCESTTDEFLKRRSGGG